MAKDLTVPRPETEKLIKKMMILPTVAEYRTPSV